MTPEITVVGLTGGIASGKSTVAGYLRDAGLPVIDADSLGHMVLDPGGAAHEEVIEIFGPQILGPDGVTIDRQALGREVFDDAARRAELERITHPAIAELAAQGLALIAERGMRLAIYEAALLVETGTHRNLAALIVVSCSLAAQIDRVCARDGFTREAAAARIASQLPLEEKLAVADFVLTNDGTPEELAAQVAELVDELRARFGGEPR
jgi:dephospho-CoA kinase